MSMLLVDRLILLAAVLLLADIVSSKFSARIGLPVLVLFLGIGMLAGEDGGLKTRRSALRAVWQPSLLLATVGVIVTAVTTGLAAASILGVRPLVGLLQLAAPGLYPVLAGASGIPGTDGPSVLIFSASPARRLPPNLSRACSIMTGRPRGSRAAIVVGPLRINRSRRD